MNIPDIILSRCRFVGAMVREQRTRRLAIIRYLGGYDWRCAKRFDADRRGELARIIVDLRYSAKAHGVNLNRYLLGRLGVEA